MTKVTDLIDNVLQSLAGAQRVFAVLDAPQEILLEARGTQFVAG